MNDFGITIVPSPNRKRRYAHHIPALPIPAILEELGRNREGRNIASSHQNVHVIQSAKAIQSFSREH